MRFVRAWPRDPEDKRKGAPSFLPRRAHVEPGALYGALARATQLHGIFAISEICKGLVVVAIGDIVIADELGELVGVAAQGLSSLREAGYFLHAEGKARNLAVMRGDAAARIRRKLRPSARRAGILRKLSLSR